ncbi:MAG: glycoside hydrolase family 2 TIM barrel-domain containing protein [Bryobacteraceae bacterium]
MRTALVIALTVASAPAVQTWNITVEEPTGLYPRSNEIIAVPLTKLASQQDGYTVITAAGRELPTQRTATHLLFPATVSPGELPAYTIQSSAAKSTTPLVTDLYARRLGLHRLELGNSRFRLVIDLKTPAIIEAYSLSAAPNRAVNLVETSPESKAAVRDDIHATTHKPLPPVPGVDGENTGWSTPGATEFTTVDFLESGPLQSRLRLSNATTSWEFTWRANTPVLEWKAAQGFRFLSLSADPYLPFNRCVDGSEYLWPSGPDLTEPEPHAIAPRPWSTPPGGHFVYYTHEANYGALGLIPITGSLQFKGACSRKFTATGDATLALTFPTWQAANTVLDARRIYRTLRQPVLVTVSQPRDQAALKFTPAPRQPQRTYASAAPTPFQPQSLSLDGSWQLAFTEPGQGPPTANWRTAKVPGSVHHQWLRPDQIYTREAEWLSRKEWWYQRTVTIPETFRDKNVRLEFDATDYYATVFWDHQPIARHEGYIDPWHIEIPDAKPGEHQLTVRTWTPVSYYWKHRPYNIKGSYGAVDQKPDDITALGITRSVRLTAYDGPTIEDIAVDTRLISPTKAEVIIDARAAQGTFQLTLSPRNFQSTARYQVTGAPGRFVIPIDNPQLWWTWDHGKPNLYTLDVRLLDPATNKPTDARTLAVGIREIEKIGWDFYLNRKRLFIRGTNYYHNLFLAEMSRDRYARDLDLMLGMNVNMIRLHCHFANPEFYQLADERGVLLWQDFLEAWYPHDNKFSLHASALYDNHIRYVRNHPSVALWAASDEEDWDNYRDLTKHLAARPAFLDPQQRPAIRSTGRFGDSHIYYGWYNGSLWDYAKVDQAFISELGATLLPNYETLVKFMGAKWPIKDHEEEWTWRRLQIPEAMRAWGDPGNLSMQEYIPRTQAYVARLFQIAIERTRQRKKQGAGGILHFHAIDIWPSVTMAAIDFDRRPTKVWDTVKRSFAPIAATFQYDRDQFKPGEQFQCVLWAINDQWKPIQATIDWRILDHNGATQSTGSFPAPLQPDDAIRLGQIQWRTSTPGHYTLQATVRAHNKTISENIFEFTVSPQ